MTFESPYSPLDTTTGESGVRPKSTPAAVNLPAMSVADYIRAADRWVLLARLLCLAFALLILATFLDYGITYDEDWHHKYAGQIIQWYASGFRDPGAMQDDIARYESGFFPNVVENLVALISPLGLFETSHLVNALFAFLAVVATFRLGALLAGPFAGLLSATFLLVTPQFYGHAFNNSVDIPMAALSALTLYYLVQMIPYLPRPPRGLLIKLSVALGLALGTRTAAALLVGYVGLGLGLWLAVRFWLDDSKHNKAADFRKAVVSLTAAFGGICIIAYAVMLVWWPPALAQPLTYPFEALRNSVHFENSYFDVFFDGRLVPNVSIPRIYLLKLYLVTLPEFYFVALAAAAVLGLAAVRRIRKLLPALASQQTLGTLIMPISVVLPLGLAIRTQPVGFDMLRHLLFIIPSLAIISAIAVVRMVERLPNSPVSGAVVALVFGSVALTTVDMAQLHPDEYVYFNRIFGHGVAEAARSYETDYWGLSYKEGAEWIATNYAARPDGQKIKVASCLYSLSASYFLPTDRFEYVGSFHDGQLIAPGIRPDLFLASTRWDCDKKLDGRVVHVVTRQNAPLSLVKQIDRDY